MDDLFKTNYLNVELSLKASSILGGMIEYWPVESANSSFISLIESFIKKITMVNCIKGFTHIHCINIILLMLGVY